MMQQMLALHWKAARWGLMPWVVAAFGIPFLIAGRIDTGPAAANDALWQPVATLSPLFPLLAVAAGATVALTAWSWDHKVGHVYALALPVTRWKYASSKFLAGLALAAIPAVSLAVGGALAAGTVHLPELVQAYPAALAFRFYLATLAAYGVLFALAAGTMRTAVVVLTVTVGTVVLGDGIVEFAARVVPALEGVRVTDVILDWTTRPASPFRVFTGNWFLFDV